MSRVLLVGFAVIAAVLGYLMDNVWLLSIGGALFVIALLTLVGLSVKRKRRRAEAERRRTQELSREDELRSLGISDIRPKGQPVGSAESVEEDGWDFAVADDFEDELEDESLEDDTVIATEADEGYDDAVIDAEPVGGDPEKAAPVASTGQRVEPVRALQARDDSPFWKVHSPTAINSFLRALWAAAEVQTVGLFSTDAQQKFYTLEAALSHSPAVRREGRFAAADFLAHAVSLDRPITVLEENDPLLRALPYYRQPVHVGGAAVLPVEDHEGHPAFLVVDLPPDQTGFTERQRTLLLSNASLLGTMLGQHDEEANARAVPTRRSIIAEEMERAHRRNRPLALALVYRADAEAVAEQGDDAVAEAERELRLHLEDVGQGHRIERFGEQMYGVFLHEEDSALHHWAEAAGRADVPVVIGVARLGDHHADADALRADAANALQEAFAADPPVVIA